jgi:hypothetical protein
MQIPHKKIRAIDLTAEKPVSVSDIKRKFYIFMIVFLAAFASLALIFSIYVRSLPVPMDPLVYFTVILLIVYAPIYLYIRRWNKVEFYEDYVRCFQRKGAPVDIPYPNLDVYLTSSGYGQNSWKSLVLSVKGSGSNPSSWKIPESIVWKTSVPMPLSRWLRTKKGVAEGGSTSFSGPDVTPD